MMFTPRQLAAQLVVSRGQLTLPIDRYTALKQSMLAMDASALEEACVQCLALAQQLGTGRDVRHARRMLGKLADHAASRLESGTRARLDRAQVHARALGALTPSKLAPPGPPPPGARSWLSLRADTASAPPTTRDRRRR